MVVPRLLITDDDLALRRAIADVFAGRGLEVAMAGDGDEAISLIETGEIHLIVLDVHMPKVSGLEVMRHVRRHDHRLPCILMSAALNESIEREAEEMHAYRIFSKPVRVTTLRESVMQGLQEIYGWRAG
jgi:DNA-binding NtrC family response regulator